jgi:penicillin-binding protein 1C
MKRLALAVAILALPFVLFAIADFVTPFPEARLHRAPATVVYDRDGEPLRMILPADQKVRIPVTLDELSPELLRALVTSEDQWFWRHPGVNPIAIARAMVSNVRARRVVSGASTIPMQLARMSQPKSRTMRGKFAEAFRALQLVRHHSRRELLEAYVNMAPYGANIEGIGAASYLYFGKPPSQLSLGEIAFLTTLPRLPNRYDPLRDHDTATRARDRVLRQLRDRGACTTAQIEEASRQTLPRSRRKPPFVAPHFCDYAVQQARGSARVYTTLDRRLQRVAEQQVASRISTLRAFGVSQTAVVVIDNRTREVVAMVGSAAFFDPARQGQVNGAVARRSPGSTLKPFLYAKAFDDGRLIPDAFVLDIPTDYAGYVPENYDGTYRGRVTVRDALVQSLNAPAVRVLADERVDEFVRVLRRGGLTSLDRDPSRYGLPLILGGGEVRLLDLTNLYATLAAGGLHRPARVLRSNHHEPPTRIFSAESTALVTTILAELKRPDMARAWQLAREMPAVAWKTGTSYGHRDAWSVGFSERYSIGVWAGNFDGHGEKGMSGSEFAAPLLFDLFRAIEGDAHLQRREALGIGTIELCAVSHQLPTEHCRDRIRAEYIPGRTRLHACEMHRAMFVDVRSGARLAGDCIATVPHRQIVATINPPELVAWWRAQNQPYDAPPPLSASCSGMADEAPPKIVSPDGATPYRLRRDAPLEFQEILLSAQTSDAAQLYWFEDGVLVASGDASRKMFVKPSRGTHQLVVVDDAGRSDSIRYRVD